MEEVIMENPTSPSGLQEDLGEVRTEWPKVPDSSLCVSCPCPGPTKLFHLCPACPCHPYTVTQQP